MPWGEEVSRAVESHYGDPPPNQVEGWVKVGSGKKVGASHTYHLKGVTGKGRGLGRIKCPIKKINQNMERSPKVIEVFKS